MLRAISEIIGNFIIPLIQNLSNYLNDTKVSNCNNFKKIKHFNKM